MFDLAAHAKHKPLSRSLAILCGGASRRLGTDKGLHRPLGDETLVERSVRLLGADFEEVLIVTRDPQQAELYRDSLPGSFLATVRVIQDDPYTPQATLAGVAAALKQSQCPEVLFVPVDQVGVRRLHYSKLCEANFDNAILFEGHPFPSIWKQTLASRVDALIKAGSLSVAGALAEWQATRIPAGAFYSELSKNGNTAAELSDFFGQPLHDPYQRRLHYLRLSLTEACNLSCTYCLPDGFPEWYRHKARLQLDEIKTILKGFRRLGFRKLRLTGGEPTVHPRCFETIDFAREIGFEEIAITTNALLIENLEPWAKAGLNQVNVSLDTLDPKVFKQMTKSDDVEKVVAVIDQAISLGLTTKVNAVLMRTINGAPAQIRQMIEWAIHRPLSLRFIELMDTGLNRDFATRERVLGHEVQEHFTEFGLAPDASTAGVRLGGPAENYSSERFPGSIGLINPLSCNFCSRCNRLRVTARGELKMCLFGEHNVPLDLSSADALAAGVRKEITTKPEQHYLEQGKVGNVSTFRTIGG